MRTLNLGIVAHVDAGKTSLTERLLHAAGVIDAVGRVDDGTTHTDTLALERERGITIRSAVVSFEVGSTIVNLIDTPGHPDFIAEVDRVIGLLDGAVLVVSAVEGVQAQTRVLMRALRRLGVPTMIFVNKIDRMGADVERTVAMVRSRLSPDVVVLSAVDHEGTPAASVIARDATNMIDDVWAMLAEHDDRLLARYVNGPPPTNGMIRRELRRAARSGSIVPVLLGSAITGAGVAGLLDAIPDLLPSHPEVNVGRPDGMVFKIERGATGERTAIVRMTGGALHARERVVVNGRARTVTRLDVFAGGTACPASVVGAGRIARIGGLGSIRIGDRLDTAQSGTKPTTHFAPPQFTAVVTPCDPTDRRALGEALGLLADEDPLIGLHHDEVRGELAVALHGDVQREVIIETLQREFGLAVEFGDTSIICTERILAAGEAAVSIRTRSAEWPFVAGLGLRVEPGDPGSGVVIDTGLAPGRLPAAFVSAAVEGIGRALAIGPHGWAVADCRVTITSTAYYPRQSRMHGTFDKNMSTVANDFRLLAPLMIAKALGRAGTVVEEPYHRFHLEVPAETGGPVSRLLASVRATPDAQHTNGDRLVIVGEIPAARLRELRQRLPGLTAGDSFVESGFAGYHAAGAPPPTRPRPSPDPYDRRAYLRDIADRL